MLFSKVKKVVALRMLFVILTVGTRLWHAAAVAGQAEERPQQRLPGPAPSTDAAPAGKVSPRPIPSTSRTFQIDLKIVEKKDGQRNLLAEPRLLTLEGRPASFTSGDYRTISLGGGLTEEIVRGPSVCVVIRSVQGRKVFLDLTLRRPTQGVPLSVMVSRPVQASDEEFLLEETKTLRLVRAVTLGKSISFQMDYKGSSALTVTAKVTAVAKKASLKTIAAAEKDLKLAESSRRTGHPDSARGYYELICHRYPATLYAERAKKRLAEMKKPDEKPPARVGQIFLLGNKKISDDVILKKVALFPGQILIYSELRLAEKKLSRLKGLKNNPSVTVIDREGDGVFKNIQITVEEK